MDLELVAAATGPLVTRDEAKAHLRVETNADDTLIDTLCAVATELIEGREGWTRRAGGVQTWKLRLDDFPQCRSILLPLPPLKAVDSVKYLDLAGAEQTFSPSLYTVNPRDLFGEIRLAYNANWPPVSLEAAVVTIQFQAGYTTPPTRMKQAALLTIGALYAGRGDDGIAKLPDAAERLLMPLRVHAWQGIIPRGAPYHG